MPRSRPGDVTAWPSMSTTPSLAGCVPRIARSKVDFPQPLGPTSDTIWPRTISRLTSNSTCFGPKLWEIPLHSRTMSCMGTFRSRSEPGAQLVAQPGQPGIDRVAEDAQQHDVDVDHRHVGPLVILAELVADALAGHHPFGRHQ